MSQQPDEVVEDWEFALDETVTLLWLIGTTGLVIGRSEFSRKDDEYLVEFTGADGRLVTTMAPGDALDHLVVQ